MDHIKYGDKTFEGQFCVTCGGIKSQDAYKEVGTEFRMSFATAKKSWNICKCA